MRITSKSRFFLWVIPSSNLTIYLFEPSVSTVRDADKIVRKIISVVTHYLKPWKNRADRRLLTVPHFLLFNATVRFLLDQYMYCENMIRRNFILKNALKNQIHSFGPIGLDLRLVKSNYSLIRGRHLVDVELRTTHNAQPNSMNQVC